ncbi:MAG: hypothetical protein HC941_00325 [Microcoleus sp. SU_5_3]|nr:hypothetical protein [Microcoleus sp. SU_5_3]
MPKRVSSRTRSPSKRTSKFSSVSDGGMFESRPFVVQSKVGEEGEKSGLKTSLMRAENYGHHLSQLKSIDVSDPTTVQPKMGMGQPVSEQNKSIQLKPSGSDSDSEYEERQANERQRLGLRIPDSIRKEHFERGVSPGRTHFTSPLGNVHNVDPNDPKGREVGGKGKALEMDHKVDSVDLIPAVDQEARKRDLSPASTGARQQQAHAWSPNFQLISHQEHVNKGGRHHSGQGTGSQQKAASSLAQEVFNQPIDLTERDKRASLLASQGHTHYSNHLNYQLNASHPSHGSSGAPTRQSNRITTSANYNGESSSDESSSRSRSPSPSRGRKRSRR